MCAHSRHVKVSDQRQKKMEKASCLHILNSVYGDQADRSGAKYHGNLIVNSTAKHHSFVKYIVLQALSNKR